MKEILEEYLSVLSSVKAYLEELRSCGYFEMPSLDLKEDIVEEEKPRLKVGDLTSRRKRTEEKGVIVRSAPPEIPSLFGPSLSSESGLFEGYDMERLREEALSCRRCELHKTRTKVVFGVGDENATLMFVGEAPGRDEDLRGEPFVGRAGQLLDRILAAIGLSREEVYITNVLKCRPPNNRDPLPSEVEACEPFLLRQIELVKPKLICALGRHAAHTLLKTKASLKSLRGRFHSYHGIKLLVTYHPASLLRNPGLKRPTWEDMKMLRAEYDRILRGEG
ncbi:uracil-DNA glycosylase [Candidatus Poribacteria bacterium]|nr:uracil-DNA glycosylase [Candidatus Poribacteria bacterium]